MRAKYSYSSTAQDYQDAMLIGIACADRYLLLCTGQRVSRASRDGRSFGDGVSGGISHLVVLLQALCGRIVPRQAAGRHTSSLVLQCFGLLGQSRGESLGLRSWQAFHVDEAVKD